MLHYGRSGRCPSLRPRLIVLVYLREDMRMRFCLFALLFLLSGSIVVAQAPASNCVIQELAIDAALGSTDAQYNLAVEFFTGRQVPRDYAKAANLWRKASDAGSVPASNNLGFLKYYGRPGVERDYGEGIRLWRFAAERGFAESQVHLGQAYSDGSFLKSDFIEAYAWAKAGKHNSTKVTELVDDPQSDEAIAKDAEEVLAIARKRLSKVELAQAEKKAADYIANFAPR
jgi:TPR repeat protein